MPRSIARGCSPELLPLRRDRQGVVIWLLLTVVTLLNLSCSDAPGSVAGVGDVSGLEISPGQLVLDDGETMELSARLKDRAGNVVSVLSDRGAVDWTVTPRDVVTISADGLLNALRPGSARVKAEYGNLNAWADVEVLPVPVELASAMTEGVRGTAGRELADSVSVVVLDRHHLPAVRIAVEFIVAAGTGHVSADRVETGPDGAARVAWTLGSEAGANQLRATVEGLDPLTIDAEALADVLSSELLLVSGNNQVGEVGQPLSDPLVVRAVDQYGNPVRGIAVNWVFANLWADGTTTVQGLETMISGPDGIAEIAWVLGPQVGDHIATATIMGSSAAAAQSVSGTGGGSDLSITRQRFSARGQPGEPRNIVITPLNPSVPVGGTVQMTGVVVDAYKNPTPDQTFTWEVSRPSVATISASGLVTGLSAGKSDIFARKDGRWSKTKLTVLASAPGAIQKASGDGQTGTVGTGLPNPLAAKVVDGGGSPMAGVSVQWSVTRGNGSVAAGSSDTDASGVARIDLTLGVTAGANEVTASAPGTGSVVFGATGSAGPAADVTVSPSYASLDVSDTQQLTTTVKDGHGNVIAGASVGWSSTNTSVATTNPNGLVAAVGRGVADIRATSGSASGTARVDVGTTQPLTAPTTLNLSLGSILPATDEIEILADWSAVSTGQGYGWSFTGGSSSPAQSGHDTDRAETIVVDQITSSYTATVCAWATRGTETGPQKCGTVSIPARSSAPPTITGLTVSPTGATLDPSDTQQFTAAAQMSDGSTATVSVSWSATGGTVSTGGLYTAGATAGSFQVTATEPGSGLTATALITVQSPPSGPQPLTAPASVNLSLGASSGVRTIDLNTDWSSVTGADRYGWDFDGGTMSPPQDGETTGTSETLVIAQRYKAYTATVCVWALRGATEVGPQTCSQITVPKEGATPPPPPTLSGVTVSPGSVSIDQGDTQQFTAAGVMSDGTTQSVTVTWSGLGGSISSGGLYTAGSIDGSYTVTATETATGLSGSANVTVTDPSAPPPPVVQIVIQPGSTSLYQGGSQQYSCHAVMSDGTTQTGMTVNWSATGGSINPSGYYTAGNSNGNYQVTVVDPATGMSATSAVDVSTPPPPPPPPPSGGLAVDYDFSTYSGLSSVTGFFYDCQFTGGCPGGATAKTDGGITLRSDATYGQVLRIRQEQGGAISFHGTVKGRFSVPPDSVVWFQSMVRYANNWNASVASSYKYNFFYLSNGGTQRLYKCCAGPGGQMSHGFGGGTTYGGTPPLVAGRDNSGWWTSSSQWIRVTGWYIREGGDISSGWLLEEVGGAGRHAFFGGRFNGVPQALSGTNNTGHGPMVIYRVSQGENINNPPLQTTHVDYAYVRAWSGVKDPLGLLNQVR